MVNSFYFSDETCRTTQNVSDRNSFSPEIRNFIDHAMPDYDTDGRKLFVLMNPVYGTGKVQWPFHLMQLSNIIHVIFIMTSKTYFQSIADGLYLMVSFLISSSLLLQCKM